MTPGLIDRSLAREVGAPFAASLAFLFALLFAMQMLRGIEVVLGSAVRAVDLARMASCLTPHFLVMAMPIALLFAVLLGVGRWAEDHEIVALFAAGLAPWRLWLAPVALGAAVAIASVALARDLEPRGLAALKPFVNELIKRNMAGDVRPGVFYDTITGVTLWAQAADAEGGGLTNVLLADERDRDRSMLVLASQGRLDPGGGGQSLRLLLGDGEVHRAAARGGDYAVVGFRRAELDASVGGELWLKNRFGAARGELTSQALEEAARSAEEAGNGREARSLRVALSRRAAAPLSSIAFALCGVPLAMGRRRGARSAGAVAALAVFVGYYVAARGADILAEAGQLPAWLAPHLPNLVLAILALGLMRRATRAGA